MVWQGQRGTELPSYWPKLRLSILERDGWVCRINDPLRCILNATEVDHAGDKDDHRPEFLRAACKPCHAYRSAMQGVAARPSTKRPREQHPADRRAARQTRI